MYKSYEEDFNRIVNSLQEKLSYPKSELSLSAISDSTKEVEEAEKCLRQMEIELAVIAPSNKAVLSSQCRKYKENLEGIKRSFRAEESRISDKKNKDTLMGSTVSHGSTGPGFGNQREKLLAQGGLMNGISRLEEAKRAGYEAEGYAVQSMNELKGQREKIEHAIQNNREIGDNLSQGTRILNNMIRRNVQNKLIMFGIALMLVLAIVFLIYMKIT